MTHECSRREGTPQFWRTLEERAGTDEFWASIEREFDPVAPIWDDLPSRRQFLQSLGATLALAGFAGCVQRPDEPIVPQVIAPEQRVPGRFQSFATAMPQPGGALGLLVTSHEGRPIKVEGNPLHPASRGATDARAQASVLDLYDPDRSQVVRRRDEISYFGAFLNELKPRIEHHRRQQGRGLHVVTKRINSPTLLDQLRTLLEQLPESHWHVLDVLSDSAARTATRQAFGEDFVPVYRLDRADVVFAVDADLLGCGPEKTRLAREFGERRRSRDGQMLRLYAAEATPSLTGAAADHRLALAPDHLPTLLLEVARRLGVEPDELSDVPRATAFDERWLSTLVADLQQAGARSLVAVGPSQPAAMHLLAWAINERLGGLHETVTLFSPIDRAGDKSPESLADLVTAMQSGSVETLLVLDANPAYGHPDAAALVTALEKVAWSAHCGQLADETAAACLWHIPTPHFLETWSDARHSDGTASLIQPLIAPLYNSQSLHHILDQLLRSSPRTVYDIVRGYWREQWGDENFERTWRQSLHDGVVADSAAMPSTATLSADWSQSLREWPQQAAASSDWQLVFRPDPNIDDGESANNAWLQELPRPFTTETWGNAAWVSAADAAREGWKSGDVVSITHGDQQIAVPVCVVPGQTARVCTLLLGHGRRRSGRHGTNVGVDVSPLQSRDNVWTVTGVTLQATGVHVALAIAQPHQFMENRDLIRTISRSDLDDGQTPSAPGHHAHGHGHAGERATLYPDMTPDTGPQWGMVIDLGVCVGCNACMVACQAENNIPSVGAEQVRNGRRMHWLRIDTYYTGEPDTPDVYHQPVLCMHCEHAPCEPVCPVAATTHSPDGLNEMTYNRCIGTRYCSNNCPYKVRRFNFLDYHRDLKALPVLQLQPNPDVTVRSRGVMEKCTYCVQRIRRAGIDAQVAGRELADGDVVTACQAACPTGAIVFGNIADPESQVAVAKSSPLNYGLLADLNTRPRTTYHAAVRNPHPDLIEGEHT